MRKHGSQAMRILGGLGLLVLLLPGVALGQRGALILPMNLAELVESSEFIVVGRVVSATAEKHPELTNLDTVVVTVRVEETWKGPEQATLTFRQYVWDLRDVEERLGYRPGQSVLLMLIRPSEAGLSSPAGLTLGRFRLTRDAQGRRAAVNRFHNRGLLEGVQTRVAEKRIRLTPEGEQLVRTHRQGALALEELKSLVQRLAGQE